MIPEKVKNHKALTEKRTKIVKNEEQLLEDVKPTEKVKKKKKRVEGNAINIILIKTFIYQSKDGE